MPKDLVVQLGHLCRAMMVREEMVAILAHHRVALVVARQRQDERFYY